MIRYSLACEAGHEFESWFPSAASYDEQEARGLVACPACGSAKVAKQIMAPRLGRKGGFPAAPPATPNAAAASPDESPAPPPSGGAPVPQSMALMSERDVAMRSFLRAIRTHVVQNADNVGRGFADEARRMHYGEVEHRSIYGEANAEEAKALMDEGIEVQPLPSLPDDRN